MCNGPSILPGFLGNLRRRVGRLDRRRLALGRRVLLDLVRSRNRRRLLPLLASLARRGRTARVRLPFPLPLEAPAAPEVKAKAPGKSRPDGTTGGWRNVIDLSHLNEFVQLTPFKMETVASVLLSVREGDFLASLDLKDAYFQILIHRSSRKLLMFTSEGMVYQFHALCFGLSTASQVFTRVFAVVSAWAHSHRIWTTCWFSPPRGWKPSRPSSLSLCHTLGMVINEKKSDLVPSQTAKYLGMTFDTEAGKVFPSLARVEKFLTVAESFCTMDAPPAQLWQVILGHLALLEQLVPHGRLRMRTLQWHLKAHWSPESDPPSLPVPLPREVRRDLSWWMVRDHLLTGVRFRTPAPDLHLYSDASCLGWGAHPLDQHVSAVWSDQEKLLHINLLFS